MTDGHLHLVPGVTCYPAVSGCMLLKAICRKLSPAALNGQQVLWAFPALLAAGQTAPGQPQFRCSLAAVAM